MEVNSSSSMLKEFMGVCVCLEEAELQKPLRKKIACANKEHDDLDQKRKRHEKPKLCHERRHGLGKHHQSKCKKKFCDYHEAHSARALYYGTAEAPVGPVC
eukprot:9366566-Ditylum_brightwellii.AAC.1